MKKSALLLSFITFGLFTACETLDTATDGNKNSNIIITSDPAQLNKRMDFSRSGVITIKKSSMTGKSVSAESDLPLTQISEVKPPVDANGQKLQASHVCVNGNYAYVSYNKQGADYSGAIDVIDVSDPYKPSLVMSALIANTDINSVTYSNGKLLIAAATDVDKKTGLKNPAIVMNMQLTAGLLTANCTDNYLEGYATTDIAANTNSYFAVTGDNGKLFKVNRATEQVTANIPMADLRSVSLYQDKIVTLSGKNGVNVYNESDLSLSKKFSVWTDKVDGAKRTIDFQGQKLLVSEGINGIGVYDMTSGNKLQTLELGSSGGDDVTNAVSVNGDYAFAANGALGLHVYKAGTTALTSVGTLDTEGSCNYVKTSGDYIYVASGKGGMKIIKMEKPATPSINCTGFPAYTGDSNLNVNSGQVLGYSGATALNWVNVNASLTLCGSTSIQNDLNINSGGVLKMYGALSQGKSQSYLNLNGELQIEGNVVIWGNFTMNSGAKLTFLGNNSSITIYGKVTKNSGVTITGNYTDTEHKLK